MNTYQTLNLAKNIVKALSDHGYPSEEEIVTEAIQNTLKGTISTTWSIYDVHSVAENNEIELTDEEAQDILDEIEHRFDAGIGINWDVIDAYVLDYQNEKEES